MVKIYNTLKRNKINIKADEKLYHLELRYILQNKNTKRNKFVFKFGNIYFINYFQKIEYFIYQLKFKCYCKLDRYSKLINF